MNATLLPPNASPLQKQFESLTTRWAFELAFIDAWNPSTCPLAVLPWLAWALSVDTWEATWPEATQRAVVAGSIATHRLKGTVASVKNALADAGYPTAVIDEGTGDALRDGSITRNGLYSHGGGTEWANYIVTLGQPISIAQAQEVTAVLNAVAPARCKLKALIYTAVNTHNGLILRDGSQTRGSFSPV